MTRVVVVTGASAGVGRATARRFAARGDRVALLARSEQGLAEVAAEVSEAGGEPLVLPTDVADAGQVDDAAAAAEAELGPIDVWVNNAMTSVFAPFTEIATDEFRRVTDVTYHGYVHGTRAALRHMLPRDRGVIVQVGSALAYRGIPLQTAYCGAKHAIQGFTESLRCELVDRGSNVRIAMVQLPAVNTPQFDWVLSRLPRRAQPVPPIFQPEIPADAILHLADDPRRELWVGWSTVRAITANKLVPGILDLYLGWKGAGSQQTDEEREPDRPSNLWEPVDGLHEAHGSFDHRAVDRSPLTWLSLHRPTLNGLRDVLVRRMGVTR
jgi:NAD(P)-dependent dehydrogenase (short-subunit alcohol dehydrogenase family)